MNTRINPQELCNRKLWQLAEATSPSEISAEELSEVIAELARRSRDMEQLQTSGKLGEDSRS